MNHIIIEGKNTIETILQHTRAVKCIFIDPKQSQDPKLKAIIELAKHKHVSVDTFTKQDKHKHVYKKSATHAYQHVAASCNLPSCLGFEQLKSDLKQLSRLIILDHIQDPFNFGAIIRSSVALHYDGIIFPKDRAANISAGVIQSSCGACYLQRLYSVSNISLVLQYLKKQNVWLYGSSLSQATPLQKTQFNLPYGLIIGNESKGLSRNLIKYCDSLIKIEQNHKIESLNASAAAAIMMYKAREKST